MQRQPVTSSNLRSVGYDAQTSTLEVEFHHGAVYQYFEVPESRFTELLAAASKGSYFNDHIKDQYRYRKVR